MLNFRLHEQFDREASCLSFFLNLKASVLAKLQMLAHI